MKLSPVQETVRKSRTDTFIGGSKQLEARYLY